MKKGVTAFTLTIFLVFCALAGGCLQPPVLGAGRAMGQWQWLNTTSSSVAIRAQYTDDVTWEIQVDAGRIWRGRNPRSVDHLIRLSIENDAGIVLVYENASLREIIARYRQETDIDPVYGVWTIGPSTIELLWPKELERRGLRQLL